MNGQCIPRKGIIKHEAFLSGPRAQPQILSPLATGHDPQKRDESGAQGTPSFQQAPRSAFTGSRVRIKNLLDHRRRNSRTKRWRS